MLPVKEIDTYAQRRCCLYLTDQLPEGKEEFPKDFGFSSGLSRMPGPYLRPIWQTPEAFWSLLCSFLFSAPVPLSKKLRNVVTMCFFLFRLVVSFSIGWVMCDCIDSAEAATLTSWIYRLKSELA